MSKNVPSEVCNPLKIIKFVGNKEQSHVCPLPLELYSVKPTRAQHLWSHRHYSVSWGENNLSEEARIAPGILLVQPLLRNSRWLSSSVFQAKPGWLCL